MSGDVQKYNDQNYEIDIDKLYDDLIADLDNYRCYMNYASKTSKEISDALDFEINPWYSFIVQSKKSFAELFSPEKSPQESRCHTFFRLIGLPAIASDKKTICNPGYNPNPANYKKFIENVAKKQIDGFDKLSKAREEFAGNMQKEFFNNQTIDATVLTLSSSTNTRKFSSPLDKNTEPLDMVVDNQKYTVTNFGFIGNEKISLNNYYLNPPDKPEPLSNNRTHIIKPFITDAIINILANISSKKKIAVPFLTDASQLKIGEDEWVRQPLLEVILTSRFLTDDNSIGDTGEKIKQYVDANPSIQDENLIKKITRDPYSNSEKQQFYKYLQIITSLMKNLVDAQLAVQKVQNLWYYIPIPDKRGPEYGLELRPILINSDLPIGYVTPRDREIIEATCQVKMNQLNSNTDQVKSNVDPNNYAFTNLVANTVATDDKSTTSLGDKLSEALDKLNKKRTNDLNAANIALKKIEIIMGEFSGLGLCDVIAMLAALSIMPQDDMCGFLDDEAFDRAQNQTKKTAFININRDINNSLKSFTETVKDFYDLMDKIYKDILVNGMFEVLSK